MDTVQIILSVVYALASWWAFGYLFQGSVLFGSWDRIFIIKWLIPLAFGFLLIPAAVIKALFVKIFG